VRDTRTSETQEKDAKRDPRGREAEGNMSAHARPHLASSPSRNRHRPFSGVLSTVHKATAVVIAAVVNAGACVWGLGVGVGAQAADTA
jgi:hypothetical protein